MGTNDYYKENAKSFILDTMNADMSEQYQNFLKFMPKKGKILDLGCGSGRDSLYFQNLGYDCIAVDPIDEFLEHAKSIGVKKVLKGTAEELDFNNEFDGIWACASLLHVPSSELNDVFMRCYKALRKNGIMYCSFKYGSFEGLRRERFFLDLNEESFKEYIKNTGFEIKEFLITKDVRPDREESWLNVILNKN